MTATDTVFIIFAKVPAPGTVKTRLIPVLGAHGAAALHAKMVKQTLGAARAASRKRLQLHCAPDTNDPFFRFCEGHFGVTLERQAAGDLGMRMLFAFEKALSNHPRALLLGTDCPALTERHLRQADKALREGADAVFVPCEDGGYALIGLRRVDARLFDAIDWGGEGVMAETRIRLQRLGWTWRELETLWDVDRPEDFARLEASGLLDTRRATA